MNHFRYNQGHLDAVTGYFLSEYVVSDLFILILKTEHQVNRMVNYLKQNNRNTFITLLSVHHRYKYYQYTVSLFFLFLCMRFFKYLCNYSIKLIIWDLHYGSSSSSYLKQTPEDQHVSKCCLLNWSLKPVQEPPFTPSSLCPLRAIQWQRWVGKNRVALSTSLS